MSRDPISKTLRWTVDGLERLEQDRAALCAAAREVDRATREGLSAEIAAAKERLDAMAEQLVERCGYFTPFGYPPQDEDSWYEWTPIEPDDDD